MYSLDLIATIQLEAGDARNEGAEHERLRDIQELRLYLRTSWACCHRLRHVVSCEWQRHCEG